MSVRLDYDLDADALYITLSDAAVARTVEIDPETMVDLDEAGNLVGIEVISFRRVWPLTEILARYQFSPEDEAQLRALFVATEEHRVEAPALSVAATRLVSA